MCTGGTVVTEINIEREGTEGEHNSIVDVLVGRVVVVGRAEGPAKDRLNYL
jgi:hypothetical protein